MVSVMPCNVMEMEMAKEKALKAGLIFIHVGVSGMVRGNK